ncbi:hypothetical protein D3C73_1032450 [compost metagenome]
MTGFALGQGRDGRHRFAGKAQFAVGVVFNDQEAVLDGQFQQAQAALARDRCAARVRERRHHADHLGFDARGQLIQRIHVDAIRARGHGMHRGAGVAQGLHGIGERGRFDDGVIAGLQHHAGQQRQGLL